MSESVENLKNIPISMVQINTSSANSTLDLLVGRAIEWKKKEQVARGLSSKVFTIRDNTYKYFTANNSFLTGIIFEMNLSGYVRLSHINVERKTALIDIVIGETNLWGKNIGADAINKTLKSFRQSDERNNGMTVYAIIKPSNLGSISMIQKSGFTKFPNSEVLPDGIFIKEDDCLFQRTI